jgi:ABC-2 type transport system ATP-binding protein
VEAVDIKGTQIVVRLQPGEEDYTLLPTVLIQAGYKIKLFREEELNLETAFMTLTKGLGTKV